MNGGDDKCKEFVMDRRDGGFGIWDFRSDEGRGMDETYLVVDIVVCPFLHQLRLDALTKLHSSLHHSLLLLSFSLSLSLSLSFSLPLFLYLVPCPLPMPILSTVFAGPHERDGRTAAD